MIFIWWSVKVLFFNCTVEVTFRLLKIKFKFCRTNWVRTNRFFIQRKFAGRESQLLIFTGWTCFNNLSNNHISIKIVLQFFILFFIIKKRQKSSEIDSLVEFNLMRMLNKRVMSAAARKTVILFPGTKLKSTRTKNFSQFIFIWNFLFY